MSLITPDEQMKPIYWSPVHDISAVVRGTWFFKTSMLPVDSDLANMLEKGFQEMMPWTRTYSEEVDSCLEIGPEAELKLVHKIWPSEEPETSEMNNLSTSSPPLDDGLTFVDRAAGSFDIKSKKDDPPIRLFARSSVIYANDREAQILRPSQLPSVSRGRRPLGSIRKSRMVGEPVIRGFDTKAWDKIYGTKRSAELKRAEIAAEAARLGATATFYEPGACPACVAAETTPKVTDLILVIHG